MDYWIFIMKKILFLIVIIVILVSSSVNVVFVEKDIVIEVKIVFVIKLIKNSGWVFDVIKMIYDFVKNDGYFIYIE